jgi:adenine-specific DNA-methyltransferase
MNKKDILDKIKSLDGLSNEERAYLVNLVNTKKKYGLVWEDKPEEVEEQLRTKLPILKEVKERAVINDTETQKHPNHILIEGDNLHALTALTFTHENKIDLIYIDPPYNTGNKDFIYNDHYVDKEDSYRHSKWLSFMHKRLQIAHKLLADDGVIFISIDDNEQANLTVLCNEIFGETNQIAVLPTIMNLKGNQDQFGFAGTHEYTLVYSKNKSLSTLNPLPIEDEGLNEWEEDDTGYYKKGANLKATGVNAPREKRPNLFFPLFYDGNQLYVTENDLPRNKGDQQLLPITDGKEMSWRWSKNKFINEPHNIIVNQSESGFSVYKKQRPELGDIPSKKPKSTFYKPEYSSGNGTAQLKSLFGDKVFNNPKPVNLLMDFILIGCKNDSTILDFFAGSGTLAEAVIRLNNTDDGKRSSISVSNNENQIAQNITYERVKRTIQGVTINNSSTYSYINNNLRYYQCDFVDREPSLANKRQLTQLATELLCIKENCYQEVTSQLNAESWNKLFTNGKGQYVYVVYDDLYIEEAVEALTQFVAQETPESKIKVYVFANGQYAYAEEFEDIAENITLAALPDAIYKAYQNVLPKENKEFVPVLEEDIDVEPEMDFE